MLTKPDGNNTNDLKNKYRNNKNLRKHIYLSTHQFNETKLNGLSLNSNKGKNDVIKVSSRIKGQLKINNEKCLLINNKKLKGPDFGRQSSRELL